MQSIRALLGPLKIWVPQVVASMRTSSAVIVPLPYAAAEASMHAPDLAATYLVPCGALARHDAVRACAQVAASVVPQRLMTVALHSAFALASQKLWRSEYEGDIIIPPSPPPP